MALNAYPINGILINELNRHIGAKKNVTDENVFLVKYQAVQAI